MAGGTIISTWTGAYSRDPVVYTQGPPSLLPLAIQVTNTAGNWLFAIMAWRQDAGIAGDLQYPSTINISDDAGNFWVPVQSGNPQTGIVRCAVWMAPAARAADYVFISPQSTVAGNAYQSAMTVMIAEVSADCPWFSIEESEFGYTNQGSTLTVTQTNTTTGLFSVGVIANDLNATSMPVTITASGWTPLGVEGGGKVGAFLSDGGMGEANWADCNAVWETWTGISLPVTRIYLGTSPWSIDTDMSGAISAGCKMCISIQPAYDPPTSGDLADVLTLMQDLQAAGAVADIAIWSEPYYSGLTSAEYIAAVEYYGPTIRDYYPLVFVTSTGSVEYNDELSYYPGDEWVDKVATDFYIGGNNYTTLTAASSPADSATPPKPFGIWEFNGATDPINGSSQANITAFYEYIQSYMAGRLAAGLPNADVLLFNSGGGAGDGYNWLGNGTTENAGFEGGLGNWTGAGNSSIADSTAEAHSGTHSMAMTCTTAGTMDAASCLAGNITTQGIPCAPGDDLWAYAWFYPASTARDVAVYIAFYTSGGSVISTTTGTAVLEAASTWTQAVVTVSGAPATAAYARLGTQVDSAALSEVHYVDDCYLSLVATSNDLTSIIAFGWDFRIALWQAMYTSLTQGVITSNGNDTTGDLNMYPYYAVTAGSPLSLELARASGSAVADFAGVLITVHGVTDLLPFPYATPLENWPVLITEMATGPVLNANPLFASGTTDWTAQNGTIAAVTWPLYMPWPQYGTVFSGSISLTPSGSATYAQAYSEQEPVSVSQRYTTVAWVYSVAGYSGGPLDVQVAWYNASHGYITSTTGTQISSILAGTWTQLTFGNGVYPPANAAYGAAAVNITASSGDVPASAVLYIGYAGFGVADCYQNTPVDDVAWTDLSSRNFTQDAISIDRGIQFEQQSLEAGTMSATLSNNDGALVFGNILSAYWPNVGDTDVPVRIRAVWPLSLTPYYVLFSGYTDDIDYQWDDSTRYGYMTVEASDAWSRLTAQMIGAAEQEILLDNPVMYCNCSQSGTNLAAGGGTPVIPVASIQGTGSMTQTFAGSGIALNGDQGASCWQSAGATTANINEGIALGWYPATPVTVTSKGVSVEFWMSPTLATGSQPANYLVVAAAWSRKGPMWTITLNNTSGSAGSTASITVYDQNSGATTTTSIGAQTFLGTVNASEAWQFYVTFTQSSLTCVSSPSGGAQQSVTVSCNLNEYMIGLSFGGLAGPLFGTTATAQNSVFGFMNIAIADVAVFSPPPPAARIAAHHQAALAANASELDVYRLARVTAYAGATPIVMSMRGLDLTVPPAADSDVVTGATDTSGQVASDYWTNIAGTTLAFMFVNGAGNLVYRRRLESYDRVFPQWAVGEYAAEPLNSNTLGQGASVSPWAAENSATLTSGSLAEVYPAFVFCGVFHGSGSNATPQIGYTGSSSVPVTAGDWYQMSALLYSPQGWATGVKIFVNWLTSGLSVISTVYSPVTPVDADSLLYITTGAVQAPATAAFAALFVNAGGTPASTVLFYVTDVVFASVGVVTAGGPGATAPEAPYLIDVKLSSDRALLYNQAQITQYGTNVTTKFTGSDLTFQPTSGVLVIITNQASANLRATVPYTVTAYLNNTVQALPYWLNEPSLEDLGNWIVETLAAPLLRPESVTITPAATPQSTLMALGAEVGDTTTFRRRHLGTPEIQIPSYISKLGHQIDIASGRWETKYELSPFPQGSALKCDDPILGTLTGGNLLGWLCHDIAGPRLRRPEPAHMVGWRHHHHAPAARRHDEPGADVRRRLPPDDPGVVGNQRR